MFRTPEYACAHDVYILSYFHKLYRTHSWAYACTIRSHMWALRSYERAVFPRVCTYGSHKYGYSSCFNTCKPLGNACVLHVGRRCNSPRYNYYSSAFHFPKVQLPRGIITTVQVSMLLNFTCAETRQRRREAGRYWALFREHFTMAAFVPRWFVVPTAPWTRYIFTFHCQTASFSANRLP